MSRARILTREQAIEAGRRHARDRGDRLSPTQIVRLAELVRPHLRKVHAVRQEPISRESDDRPAA